jgi:hypothetical protein
MDAKEDSGMDLCAPENDIQEAISVFYRNLVRYVIANIRKGIDELRNIPKFKSEIPVFLSGGTSMVKGFDVVFRKEMEKTDFSIRIGEIIKVSDPLRSVATGCLIASLAEYDN